MFSDETSIVTLCRLEALLQATETHSRQRQPLADVIMKFAGDPAPFFFVRFNQFLTHGAAWARR